MAKQVIKTRKSALQIQGTLKQLPDILVGMKRDHYGIRKIFWSVFAKELYKRISRGFVSKSIGGNDDLGNKWKPLSPRTIERRLRRPSRHGHLKKSSTFREAISRVKGGNVPILIDTGRLLQSLMPGLILSGSYKKKTADQIFEIKRGEVLLGTKVPYAEMQDKARSLWPKRMNRWIEESITEAIKAMNNRLKQLNRL